jgi:nucleotide-binding universal stress UspA family protein
MYKHILIPTDGSAPARAAGLSAIDLARAVGAKVTLFYAAPPATPVIYKKLLPVALVKPREHAAMIEKTAQRFLSVLEKAAHSAGVKYQSVHVTNDFPAQAILDATQKYRCDLIHLAPHSKGIARLLLGSQTQKVLAHAKVSVLVHRA